MSNLVHRRRRCARIVTYTILCLEGSTPEDREGLFLFIALRWMQDREGVMMGLTENIQACLRIFWQLQHQWLARDILHPSQGVYSVFVLHPVSTSKSVLSVLSVVEQKSRGRESLSPGEGYRSGSTGAFLYCQRQLFCFVAFRLPRADQTGGEVQAGKLACMDEHHRLAERA